MRRRAQAWSAGVTRSKSSARGSRAASSPRAAARARARVSGGGDGSSDAERRSVIAARDRGRADYNRRAMVDREEDRARLFDFTAEFLEDRDGGTVRPLGDYLARYPGLEEEVAREYLRLVSRPAPEDESRTAIGPYRLLRVLGQGGQGTVHLAQDTRIDRLAALKLLPAPFGTIQPERRRRLGREAEVISRLRHPGICEIFEAQLEGETPYLAMRYIHGEPLSARIAESTRTPEERAALMATIERVAHALHAAHEAGVIHRDVKPANVMLAEDGEPVLLDFGIARILDDPATSLTGSEDVFGTPSYMSPEQLELPPDALDRRTDVYSLGATLYECLTGRRPFESATRAGLLAAIQKRAPEIPAELGPDLRAVLETALAKERDHRYATALDLAEDLRRIREQRACTTLPRRHAHARNAAHPSWPSPCTAQPLGASRNLTRRAPHRRNTLRSTWTSTRGATRRCRGSIASSMRSRR